MVFCSISKAFFKIYKLVSYISYMIIQAVNSETTEYAVL